MNKLILHLVEVLGRGQRRSGYSDKGAHRVGMLRARKICAEGSLRLSSANKTAALPDSQEIKQ